MISGPPHTRRAFSCAKEPKVILPLAPPGRGPAPRAAPRGGHAPFAVRRPVQKNTFAPLAPPGRLVYNNTDHLAGYRGGRPTRPPHSPQKENGRQYAEKSGENPARSRHCHSQIAAPAGYNSTMDGCVPPFRNNDFLPLPGYYGRGFTGFAFLARPCSGERVALFSQGHFAKLQSGGPLATRRQAAWCERLAGLPGAQRPASRPPQTCKMQKPPCQKAVVRPAFAGWELPISGALIGQKTER